MHPLQWEWRMFEITRNSFAWLWTVTFFCSMSHDGSLDKKPSWLPGAKRGEAGPWEVKRDHLLPRSFLACMSSGLGTQRKSLGTLVITLLSYLKENTRTHTENKKPSARSSAGHNSQDLEASWVPVRRSVDKDAVPVFNGVLLSRRKERAWVTGSDVDKP